MKRKSIVFATVLLGMLIMTSSLLSRPTIKRTVLVTQKDNDTKDRSIITFNNESETCVIFREN